MQSIFLIVLIAVVISILYKSIRIVAQSDYIILERLGKFHKVLQGGIHFIIPFVDRIAAILTSKEHLVSINRQQVITKDNVGITVDGIVFVKVVEPQSATYSVQNYSFAIENLGITTLRSEIGRITLDESLSSRETLNIALQNTLADAASNWGIKVMRVEISEISVPKEIENAMNMQMQAEREKRAIELRAIANKEAMIREAEAEKQKQVLQAEAIERMADAKKYEQIALANGQSQSISLVNEQIAKSPQGAEFLLAKDRIAAFNEMSKNPSKDKVILPYEATEFIGSLSLISDFFKNK